ncbi:MAG: serine--tRNA ligase, partial [Bacteroidota bacterium]
MLDLKFIREHTDIVKQGIKAKNDVDNVDAILDLDAKRRSLIGEGEALKAKRNEVSAKVGAMKKKGEDASSVIEEMNQVKTRIQLIDEELKVIEEELDGLL